jgi:hypothetical protein
MVSGVQAGPVIIFIGMVAMEFLGMLVLAGLSMLGFGDAPWVLTRAAALPLAFVIGFAITYLLGRTLGLVSVGEMDLYTTRIDAMHDMARPGRRLRPTRRAAGRAVVIEY